MQQNNIKLLRDDEEKMRDLLRSVASEQCMIQHHTSGKIDFEATFRTIRPGSMDYLKVQELMYLENYINIRKQYIVKYEEIVKELLNTKEIIDLEMASGPIPEKAPPFICFFIVMETMINVEMIRQIVDVNFIIRDIAIGVAREIYNTFGVLSEINIKVFLECPQPDLMKLTIYVCEYNKLQDSHFSSKVH